MKNFLIALVVAAIAFCFSPVDSFAQETTGTPQVSSQDLKSLSDPQWQKIIDDLQAESKVMLDENSRLNAEYEMLQSKLSGLQDSITKLRTDIANQEAENKRLEQKKSARAEAEAGVRQDLQKMEQEVAGLEEQNGRLNQELAELEEKNSVWEAQLSDLQVQKREMLLDMKLQEFANEEAAGKDDDQLKALSKQLVTSQAKEVDLKEAITGLKEQGEGLPAEIEKLRVENRNLADQIVSLESERKQKEIENKKLEEENRRIAASGGSLPAEIVNQRRSLEDQVAKLEAQLEGLRQSVAQAKAVMDKKRDLMNDIMRLDSENQELRNRINAVLQQNSPEPDTDTAL